MFGIREVLEDSDADQDGPLQDDNNTTSSGGRPSLGRGDSVYSDSILFGTETSYDASLSATALPRPISADRQWLLSTFRQRVDPIIKILHWPSVHPLFAPDRPIENPLTLDQQALEHCIYFIAACSLSDADMTQGRQDFVRRHQRIAEAALARAKPVTSKSIITLQAFIIYICALRCCNSDSEAWTLLACAVRIATAHGLDRKAYCCKTLLEQQTRRRIWFCLGQLDMQFAADRGSRPLFTSLDFPTDMLPLDMDDVDLSGGDVSKRLVLADRCTDSCAVMTIWRCFATSHRVLDLNRQITSNTTDEEAAKVYDEQKAIINDYRLYLEKRRSLMFADPKPIMQSIVLVGDITLQSLSLALRRPFLGVVHRRPLPNDHDFDVLVAATEVLEAARNYLICPETFFFRWYVWVKWYALALVLAELCSQPDHPQSDRAWVAASGSFDQYAAQIADNESGMLWKPIARLYKRVRAIKEPGRHASVSSPSTIGLTVQTPPLPTEAQQQQPQQASQFYKNTDANGLDFGNLALHSYQFPNESTSMTTTAAAMSTMDQYHSFGPNGFDRLENSATLPLDNLGFGSEFYGGPTMEMPLDFSGLDPTTATSMLNWEQFMRDINMTSEFV